MLIRRSICRFPTPSSWTSRLSPAIMPLRAKVTNPAFTAPTAIMNYSTTTIGDSKKDDVLFNSLYGVRLIELNRPKKYNALDQSMVEKIYARLLELEKSQLASVVMLSGVGEKALCAGGDVAALALQNEKGEEGQEASANFFRLEYRLNHLIATYSKPFISVMDGITMGGGVGLSVHAPFRIATERTLVAMPETDIGFFPDVGASFFLPRLDGELGTYLALTSKRLRGAQALYAGFATHYVDSSVLGNLTQRLSELVFKDYATLQERLDLVNATIAEFSSGVPPYQLSQIAVINRCFGHNTIEEIFQALEQESKKETSEFKEWAEETLEILKCRSPTSLKVTLRQMRLGKQWSILETFKREAHIASLFMKHPDFVEGVKTKLIHKTGKPSWKPAEVNEVTTDMVDRFFTYSEDSEAAFPLEQYRDLNFREYPHHYGLPTEEEIRRFVRTSAGEDPIKSFVRRSGGKPGVQEKVSEVLSRKAKKGEDGAWLWE
ncbi:mitochondrial 37S ribosomal protein mS47 [Aspergillus saccharolyticus JOP 1030-1]|uniref:3-hydroxyisobutyryl-CoA hydrolase n=1 Tax=Aspergillus saccharolyticus JOP 1030-1 TaxID=1450539 RepID=A0A318ZGW7_9EURO|nr:ClpP/crotonase [Aspergillus saccharolyticus JOP 1030-1]PYH43823.1 ClpP/crotonase [Aspergillus saccharolyticus JOP 1030-1]